MLLLAHPLHADRAAENRPRDQGCVGGGIIGTVMAVAAGALHVDAADLLWRQPQHFGDGLPVGIDALSVSPHRDAVGIGTRDGTGGSNRSVDLVRPGIGSLKPLGTCRDRLAPVENGGVLRRKAGDDRGQISLLWQARLLLPLRRCGQPPHRLDGLELAFGNDGKEIPVAHDL